VGHNKTFRIITLGTILAILVMAIPATAALAAVETINLDPEEGEIGDNVEILGYNFDARHSVYIYFSSREVNVGDDINKLNTYEELKRVYPAGDGTLDTDFEVPYELTTGYYPEDVHGGDYYVYVTYRDNDSIVAAAEFTILNGEIELDPEEGQVGTEVTISGEKLRPTQEISIDYDGYDVDIAGGDKETTSEGKFTCTFIVPESSVGNHNITVTDESGNKPEAEFSVKPKITIDPTSAATGNTVHVYGTGFARKEYITITFDYNRVSTEPIQLKSSYKGSFSSTFIVPSLTPSGISEVRASDRQANKAYVDLTISAGISLSPVTSQTSPGHVGMELRVYGTGFIANTTVTITYGNNEVITVATAPTDVHGDFLATFTVPPSVAGSHIVTATDGTITATSIFTMESEAPLMPMFPKVTIKADADVCFDWNDVVDVSGVTYTLQVASAADFTTIVLEKKGLTHSEYTITEEEKLKLTENKIPYYWRVKAVDGAYNESEWMPSGKFYIGFSWTSISSWPIYIWIGLGVLLIAIIGIWVRRRTTPR